MMRPVVQASMSRPGRTSRTHSWGLYIPLSTSRHWIQQAPQVQNPKIMGRVDDPGWPIYRIHEATIKESHCTVGKHSKRSTN
jgi:hypothetical protein